MNRFLRVNWKISIYSSRTKKKKERRNGCSQSFMVSYMGDTIREIQYNRFFLKCRFVSLHNNFEKISKKKNCIDLQKKKNDKAFTVLVYFFKRIFQCAWVTRISLLYANVTTNEDFLYETWFHLHSMPKKKKRKSDAPICKKKKRKKKKKKERRADL